MHDLLACVDGVFVTGRAQADPPMIQLEDGALFVEAPPPGSILFTTWMTVWACAVWPDRSPSRVDVALMANLGRALEAGLDPDTDAWRAILPPLPVLTHVNRADPAMLAAADTMTALWQAFRRAHPGVAGRLTIRRSPDHGTTLAIRPNWPPGLTLLAGALGEAVYLSRLHEDDPAAGLDDDAARPRPPADRDASRDDEHIEAFLDLARRDDRDAFMALAAALGIDPEDRDDLWTGTRRRLGRHHAPRPAKETP